MKTLKTLLSLLVAVVPLSVFGQTIYDFDAGNGLNQITLSTGSTAPLAVGTFSDNTTNVLNLTTGGQTCVASLNAFTGSTDCQVVWKQYYSDLFTTETKAGIVLRSTGRTSTYANGLKTGYYIFLHTNQFGGNAGKVTFRLMKVTTTGVTSLFSSAATTITGFAANSPLWLRAKVIGTVLTLDYSINGTTWTNGLNYTDAANTFPNAGLVQAVWGLGAVMNNVCYLDNITITNQDVAKVSLAGNNKYTYDGSAKGPSNATTARFTGTPTVTYTYLGIGATTYPSSATKPTNEGTYVVTASATDGVITATDQMAFDILPSIVTYDFTNDVTGSSPIQMSFKTNKSGTGIIENYSTGTSNGSKTVSKMFKPNTGGTLNQTYVADLNSFAPSTSYSITWKQYITASGQKRGFLLAAQNATTADGGTSTDTSTYAVGLKKGYLFVVYDNGTTNTEMRIYKSTYSGITNLYATNNKAVPTSATIGAARWYRATVNSGIQKFEYSNDGVTWISATESTDATFQPVAGNKVQAVGGLGGFANAVYYDYIAYTDNSVAPKVQLNGSVVYAYNGSAQSPVAVATGFTSPTITYSYSGSGTTTYGPTATAPTSSGNYVVTATANDGVLNATSSAFTYTILKATPSIAVSGTQNLTYAGVAQGPSTIAYSGDGVTSLAYSSTDGAEYAAAAAPTNFGAYQVKASATAGTFYNAASSDYYTFKIDQKSITLGGISIANKVYDGAMTAPITGSASYIGLVNGETPAITGTPVATFADATIGNAKPVTVSGYTAPNSNYLLTGQPSGFSASIYPVVSTFSKSGSSNWSTATEWTYAPIAGTELEVQSGELIVDQNAAVKSIKLYPGAKLTLNSGQTLSATQNLTIQSDANSTGTFVNNGGTLTVTSSTVQQYLSSGRNWYVSSPVSDATSAVFGAAISSTNPLYSYDEVAGTWPQITDNASALTSMKGYFVNLPTSTVVNFTGTLNDGNKSAALTNTAGLFGGYNLVGNPYPSYLDWQAVSVANPDVLPTVWYRTRTLGNAYTFDTYNATGNISTSNGPTKVTKLIPPMQAFWVSATVPTTLNLTNAMRFHSDASANRLKSADANRSMLRMKLSNGVYSDEALVYTDANATNGFDRYDSPKMFTDNTAIPELYTMAGNEKLVINGLNTIQQDGEIPLYIKTSTAGSFVLQLSEVQLDNASLRVILKDKFMNTEQDLSDGAMYTFQSGAVTADRFSLLFKSATGLNTAVSANSMALFCNAEHQIELNCSEKVAAHASLTIYNTLGQCMGSQKLDGNRTVVSVPLNAGVYMISVNNGGTVRTFKVCKD